VSEYVDGPSLRQLVHEKGPRAGSELERLAVGTATALVAIHEARIVHRDFKPGNVLMGPDGPRVVDFGIAKALEATTTTAGGPQGTPHYMSPDQLGDAQVTQAADVFAWAGTMVFASTGRAPFEAESLTQLFHRILNDEPRLDGVPPALRRLLSDCFAKDPARRPTSQQVLQRLLRGGGSTADLEETVSDAAQRLDPAAATFRESAPSNAMNAPLAAYPLENARPTAAYPVDGPRASRGGRRRAPRENVGHSGLYWAMVTLVGVLTFLATLGVLFLL
jgi:serine/threonine protein kinase